MTLVLIIGDIFIPNRAKQIPEKFTKLFTPGKIQTTLCTGNLTDPKILEYFETITPKNVFCVAGDSDDEKLQFPEFYQTKIGGYKIGMIHGHQFITEDKTNLQELITENNLDILIKGNTHKLNTEIFEETLLIDPGSITGAQTLMNSNIKPSFSLLAFGFGGKYPVVYNYIISDDELTVSKFDSNLKAKNN
ncbi:vacuolar protein sorting-associated protein [Anaeramoeba ignava]|uniref:Vacuolar protein sorting-associated protein 29 n=1 Tax=Anaeramoeba ignava TaxID=1746090 RepID=A0A9Q0LD91_ANAIG|nr:vacuolar protein sorting-associated protein [Anaeramoeba ignava]